MVKDADPVLTKVMNDLSRVTDITRILDEQEKLNAPTPHYNKPMPGASNPSGEKNSSNSSASANATTEATPAAAPADGGTAASPEAATDLPPELDPASAKALKLKSSKATNQTQNANST